MAPLNVADTAVMLMNSQNGIEVGTEVTWRHTDSLNKPVIFAMNHLEHENSNFDETVEQLKNVFGSGVTVIQYPVSTGAGFNSVIDLLKMKMYKFSDSDGTAEILDIPTDEKDKAEEMQAALIEDIAANDEELMEKFFENGTLTEDELRDGLSAGLVTRGIFPVLCINAKQNMGVKRLMEFICNNVPAPDKIEQRKTTDGKVLKCECICTGYSLHFQNSY